MGYIKFNDIFHLTENEIYNSKIALNMAWDGKSHLDRWNESDVSKREVSFSYSSHYGGKRNFREGELCFGFVRIKGDRYLLITVGRILSVPNPGTGICEHEELEQYRPFLGRLVIHCHKGNTNSRYVFRLRTMIDKITISEILESDYQAIHFKGLDEVHLKYCELQSILKGEKYTDYAAALQGIKGVYCLTDTSNGKLYIGSAYGKNGIAQRWEDYLNTNTGGNHELIKLYHDKMACGEADYFEKNFEFTLLEFFGKNAATNQIINRESFWKEAFATRANGYNKN